MRLVPEESFVQAENATQKMKRYTLPSTDRVPEELIQVRTLKNTFSNTQTYSFYFK
jgi:hypothetical protein